MALTNADKKAMRPQNIIKQDFSAQEPLRKLLTDITQIPCKDGKLYVSPLLDCYIWRDHFACNGHEYEKGTVYKNDNRGI